MFDIAVFSGFSKSELVRHFASIALGRRGYSPKVSTYRSDRVRVASGRPLPVRADGTNLGSTPVECIVRPRALRVLVPAPEARSPGT
jgi:diacylglycerol kinase family enzyme